jgi:TonB family protein
MQGAITKNLFRYSFWIVLVLHILFLLFITTEIVFLPEGKDHKVPYRVPREQAQHYVPSYVYSGSIKPTLAKTSTEETSPSKTIPTTKKMPSNEKTLAESKYGINKSNAAKQPSILNMSRSVIQNDYASAALNSARAEEPILLIGDPSRIVDPLIKLLGRSLSAHFSYPHIAGVFGVTGRVYVRLVLHPEGYYSDVQIVRSSENEDFNRAALYAINQAPTVVGANKFLKEPKEFLIGFIFD